MTRLINARTASYSPFCTCASCSEVDRFYAKRRRGAPRSGPELVEAAPKSQPVVTRMAVTAQGRSEASDPSLSASPTAHGLGLSG